MSLDRKVISAELWFARVTATSCKYGAVRTVSGCRRAEIRPWRPSSGVDHP